MKRWIAIATIAVCLAGCKQQKVNEAREESYGRWYKARAHMLCSVVQEDLRVGRLDVACRKAREAKALAPEFAEARILLGQVYIEQGKYAVAVEELTEATKLKEEETRAWYLLGVAQEKNAQPDKALESYRKVTELDEFHVPSIVAQAEVLVEMGRAREAVGHLRKNYQMIRDDMVALELTGRVLVMVGNYADAIEVYREAIGMSPDNWQARRGLVRSLMLAERYDQAKDELEELQDNKKYSFNAWDYAMLGDCQLVLSMHHRAIASYQKSCQIKPRQAGIWAKLSQAYLKAGELELARSSVRKSLAIEPRNVLACQVDAYALLQQNQPAQALDALNKLGEQPKDATVLYLIAACHKKLGNAELFQKYYRKAMEVDPQHLLSRELLKASENKG